MKQQFEKLRKEELALAEQESSDLNDSNPAAAKLDAYLDIDKDAGNESTNDIRVKSFYTPPAQQTTNES